MFQRDGAKAYKKDLNNIIALAEMLENPHKAYKSIHIAGTNGKGSSAHLIASMLQSNGLKVGLYTSPHYRDFRERIKINGQHISKVFVKIFVSRVKELLAIQPIQISFFEITVAMAFSYFKEEDVDYAVIETGLGGRLDSTNIIQPEICLITNISLDHTAFLGNTLPLIAKEKAGIIKRNIPVIIGEYQPEVASVFMEKAEQVNASLTRAKNVQFLESSELFENDPFLQKNIKSAIALYYSLSQKDKQLHREKSKLLSSIKQFKKRTNYIGRWQTLQKKPLIIADSAHNIAGLTIVFNKLKQLNFEELHIVFGAVGDKDPSKVYQLLPKHASYYAVQAKIPRAKDVQLLKTELKSTGLNVQSYSSVRKGLSIAKMKANKNDLILVVGSVFVIAEVL